MKHSTAGLRLCGAEVAGAFRSAVESVLRRFAKHGRRITSAPPPKARKSKARAAAAGAAEDSGANARNPFLNGRVVTSWAAAQLVRAVMTWPSHSQTCRHSATADMDDRSRRAENDRRRAARRVRFYGRALEGQSGSRRRDCEFAAERPPSFSLGQYSKDGRGNWRATKPMNFIDRAIGWCRQRRAAARAIPACAACRREILL